MPRGQRPELNTMAPTRGQDLDTQSLSLQLRAKRSEMMVSELEAVALRLFDQRGFANVTVEEIALEAHISVRTFYRYFAAKDDVLQMRINRRSEVLQKALSAGVRPTSRRCARSAWCSRPSSRSSTRPCSSVGSPLLRTIQT